MSRSSRSRTTFAYSVRFSRCRPGGGVYGRRWRDRARPRTRRSSPRRRADPGRFIAGRRHHARAQLADHELPRLACRARRWRGPARRRTACAPSPCRPPSRARCGRPCSTCLRNARCSSSLTAGCAGTEARTRRGAAVAGAVRREHPWPAVKAARAPAVRPGHKSRRLRPRSQELGRRAIQHSPDPWRGHTSP